MWSAPATEVAASHHRVAAAHPGRFLLGVGIGHPEATQEYRSPYDTIVDYLDVLDAEGVPVEDRVLAALGPKVLALAAERTAGAHPYLTTPEHTRLRPRDPRRRPAARSRAEGGARHRPGRGPRARPARRRPALPAPAQLHEQPEAAGLDRRRHRRRRQRRADRRARRCTATPRPSPPGSPRISTPARTTCASSCSRLRAPTRCPACARWPRPSSSVRPSSPRGAPAGPTSRSGGTAPPGGARSSRSLIGRRISRNDTTPAAASSPAEMSIAVRIPGGERRRVGVVGARRCRPARAPPRPRAARPPGRRRCSPPTRRRRTGPGPRRARWRSAARRSAPARPPKTTTPGSTSADPARAGPDAPQQEQAGRADQRPDRHRQPRPDPLRQRPGPGREHQHDHRDRQQRRARRPSG